ncbi:hypothetical protein ACN9MZ_00125 [Pseudoduganella sp. S-14]|jgi:hypothetical protein|uniref:hypothetical protein n=1 Tax=Pseudoduganella sp. S-14 TaxID=3404065 RepID=UPI003CEEB9B1
MTGKTIAVAQFDGTVTLMKIDLATGAREFVPASEVDEEKVTFGLYEIEESSHHAESIVLLATPDGPLLILNDTLYHPDADETKVEIADQETVSHFRVLHRGIPVFELAYEQKSAIGLHPYARHREDVDFYFWLKGKVNEPDFYRAYTREIVFVT